MRWFLENAMPHTRAASARTEEAAHDAEMLEQLAQCDGAHAHAGAHLHLAQLQHLQRSLVLADGDGLLGINACDTGIGPWLTAACSAAGSCFTSWPGVRRLSVVGELAAAPRAGKPGRGGMQQRFLG